METWREEAQMKEAEEWANRINTDPEMHDRSVKFFNSTGGWPPCEQALEVFEQRKAERVKQGDDNFWRVQKYTPLPTCPKCGNHTPEQFHSHYVSAEKAEAECPEHAGVREHMHRGCDACQYHWVEMPMDYDRF